MYAALGRVAERAALARLRADLLAHATGRLLVIGAGQGYDLAHLPDAVTGVIAVEPDRAMRRGARSRAAAAPVPVQLVGATAERLPVADGAVDTVLCAFVLCSVDDADASVAEIRRVLRPVGRLLVLEHVRAAPRSWVSGFQDAVDPVWTRFAAGCHLNRRTGHTLTEAGFDPGTLDVVRASALVGFLPLLTGVVRRDGIATELGRPGSS